MSELIVEVSIVSEVASHPGADRLDLVKVKGWQVVSQKGAYSVGDKVVYFPPDTILPPEHIEAFGIEKYVKSAVGADGIKRPCRISACRLRGLPSFGFVTKAPEDFNVGSNVADFYGATKYEPPVDTFMGEGDCAKFSPAFRKYEGPEHWANFPDLIETGEEVVITEKIHGRNCRGGLVHAVDGIYEFMAGSHNFPRREFDQKERRSPYWISINDSTMALLECLCAHQNDVILYGEAYGPGMQDMTYGQSGISFRAFDICVNGKYLDWADFLTACMKFKVPIVPVLYVGPYSSEIVAKMTDGETTVCLPENAGKFKGREGVVVKPTRERMARFVKATGKESSGRLILKSVSADYMGRIGGSEYH